MKKCVGVGGRLVENFFTPAGFFPAPVKVKKKQFHW